MAITDAGWLRANCSVTVLPQSPPGAPRILELLLQVTQGLRRDVDSEGLNITSMNIIVIHAAAPTNKGIPNFVRSRFARTNMRYQLVSFENWKQPQALVSLR
jgi:hypothetical protein